MHAAWGKPAVPCSSATPPYLLSVLPCPHVLSQAANTLFFNTPGGTTQTLQGWYEGCSMGRTLMTPSTSKVVSVTLPCSGTTSTGSSWSSAECDTYTYSQAANDFITANSLANLSNYRYALPQVEALGLVLQYLTKCFGYPPRA
jgi:hypothetical protein